MDRFIFATEFLATLQTHDGSRVPPATLLQRQHRDACTGLLFLGVDLRLVLQELLEKQNQIPVGVCGAGREEKELGALTVASRSGEVADATQKSRSPKVNIIYVSH